MLSLIKAAVTSKSQLTPVFKNIQLREPENDEVVVKVLATGYHHLVKARASGRHYSVRNTSDSEKVVGVDGVGYIKGTSDVVYFTTFEPGHGSYAQYVNVKKTDIYHLPENHKSEEAIASVAALSNGVMSSSFALGRVQNMIKNPTVAVLGATGTSGQLAIQVSKKAFLAKLVIGIARGTKKLVDLKQKEPLLDEIISFEEDNEEIIKSGKLDDVDVVLDYLWGEPALRFMEVLIKSKKDKTKILNWVQIGQIAGSDVALPAAYLRSTNFCILGSGLGPLKQSEMSEIIQKNTIALAEGNLKAELEAAPIEDIEHEWNKSWNSDKRKYFKFSH